MLKQDTVLFSKLKLDIFYKYQHFQHSKINNGDNYEAKMSNSFFARRFMWFWMQSANDRGIMLIDSLPFYYLYSMGPKTFTLAEWWHLLENYPIKSETPEEYKYKSESLNSYTR